MRQVRHRDASHLMGLRQRPTGLLDYPSLAGAGEVAARVMGGGANAGEEEMELLSDHAMIVVTCAVMAARRPKPMSGEKEKEVDGQLERPWIQGSSCARGRARRAAWEAASADDGGQREDGCGRGNQNKSQYIIFLA